MSSQLRLYVLAVGLVAVVLLALHLPPAFSERWGHYAAWTAICLLSESLWLPTLSKAGTASMASTTNIAALVLFGPSASMWIVCLSTLAANLYLQKKPWVRALFNSSQIVITMWVAGLAMVGFGGPAEGVHQGAVPGEEGRGLVLAFIGLVAGYLLVNRSLVSVAVSWSTGRPTLRVLREDWFFRDRLFDDVALFLLSPLMVISFRAIGYLGLAIFYVPLRIINDSGRRYAQLQEAQDKLIYTERMAAKGEMAAELGHELGNQLVAISGRAQMLLRDAERQQFGHVPRNAQIILEQAHRMEALAKGLMDFSHRSLKIEPVDVNELITRSVELVRPQNRFDGVEWDLRLASALPKLRADPGQLQQVLLNLFQNAADAMCENGGRRRAIVVRSEFDERARRVRLLVSDTGPGVLAEMRAKIFEPNVTTKREGHGFGLSTSYRIVTNHGGQIAEEGQPGEGARFIVALPLDGPGGWG